MQKPNLNGFFGDYSRMLFDSVGNNHRDNFDTRRFGREPRGDLSSIRSAASRLVSQLLAKVGLARTRMVLSLINQGISFVRPHLADLEWLYHHLADDESRKLLVQLIAYRALGHRHVKLPLNRPEYWKSIETIEKVAEGCETIDPGFMGFQLAKMNLRIIGYPIELFFVPFAVVTQFVDQPYRCATPNGIIEAGEGDVVIDAGGCWADTALYFAAKTGKHGKVASFEFLPDNLNIYQRNLNLNPDLAARIKLLPFPLWSSSDQELFINGHGPGTSVGATPQSPDAKAIRTVSMDHLLERGDFDRVDFIKMDIEGAELPALRGAVATLRRFRPKLAISVYHNLGDFWQIPQYLDSLSFGYKFYLRHFTIHAEETVLFAESVENGAAPRGRPTS